MDDGLREELEALAVAFLTQNLKENPNGVTLQYFEKSFPERMDESHDWFRKNFKMNNVLEALQAIPNAVRLTRQDGSFMVSLNPTSEKVDKHLAGLILGQKCSSKKKRPSDPRSHSQRVVDSYRMNRRYSGGINTESRFRTHTVMEQVSRSTYSVPSRPAPYIGQDLQSRCSRSTIYNSQPSRVAPGDPRARQASQMAQPQVRPAPVTTSSPTPPKQASSQSKQPPKPSSRVPATPSSTRAQVPSSEHDLKPRQDHISEAQRRALDDPALGHRRSWYRQRLMQVLSRKYPEVKILYLPRLYEVIYEEKLDPLELGFRSIHDMIRDPYFSEYMQINVKPGLDTVSLKNAIKTNGKENITSTIGNASDDSTSESVPLVDRSNIMPASKLKFNARDPFNTSKMLESLEPIREIKEMPLGDNQIEDSVKYRTMRIIWKDPSQTLKLDDWERRYQQEWNCSNKIHIRDYGFKTLLEFFKNLACDLPIRIQLNEQDEWIAVSENQSLSIWLKSKLAAGSYRAITVIDSKYDQIAYPGDVYPMMGLKNLPENNYFPATIVSVSQTSKMWIQPREQKRLENHLLVETSLSCYQDYKKQGYFSIMPGLVKVGFPCVVFDESQRRWCRALVVKVPESITNNSCITAFLVDYAVTKAFNLSNMMCILKAHLRYPVGLIHCVLHNLDKGQERLAKIMLQELTNPPIPLACLVESRADDAQPDPETICMPSKILFSITLIDTRDSKDSNLAKSINICASTPED